MPPSKLALAIVWLSVLSVPAPAQEAVGSASTQAGEYRLIYSAVRSDAVPEAIARHHGLPAEAGSVLLNVTVQHRGRNVAAMIDARAINLAEQMREIEMHETYANDLVSYIGIVNIANREVVDFQLEILPEGATDPITLEFREEFVPIPGARDEVEDPR